ncbi:MAG TPA: hypothetical protein VK550_22975 [Polyangiaceae bacterium]|nr:hypothetical protein [Polyangiaceae bacterium]
MTQSRKRSFLVRAARTLASLATPLPFAVWITGGCAPEPAHEAPSGAAGTGGSPTEDARPTKDPIDAADAASPFPRDLPRTAEMYWLTKIGWGSAQTDRVCARGNQDPVARALCAKPRAPLSSFEDLLRAFWPTGRTWQENYTAGLTFQSSALAARLVSVINPAVILTSLAQYAPGDDAGAPPEFATDLAISFTRGDQLVELLGIDGQNQRLNFYLLAFGHACRATDNCTATDVLGSRSERDWTSWTLYQDEDIEDTGLSCLSCHQSEGPGNPRRFLMREFTPFWLHWGLPSSAFLTLGCTGGAPPVVLSQSPRPDATAIIPDLAGTFARAHADETHLAGVPIETLIAQRSGQEISFTPRRMRATVLGRDGSFPGRLDNNESRFAIEEPHQMDTFGTLTGQYCQNGTMDRWNAYRNTLRREGMPVPYYQFEITESEAGTKARADYAGFLRDASSSDALDILAPLVSDDVATVIGFVPEPESDAPTILRQMCGRCHTGTESPALKRARFDARNLDRLSREAMAEAMRRVQLPQGDPGLMPPRRAGQLPAWAIERLGSYFASR